jgi:uncharacterized protein with NAD-binding domain and iron-sulfur cluster
MEKKDFETVIIGAGISGLSCARQLHDAGRDLLVISKDVGGRVGAVNTPVLDHNVAYATSDYTNVLKYAKKIEPLRLKDYYYLTDGKYRSILSLTNIRRIVKLLKFFYISRRFRVHIIKYREQAPHKSIKECFEDDPILLKYWKMPAKEFIKKHGFEEIDEIFFNPVSTATGFVESKELNTLYYLAFFFCVITRTWIIDLKSMVERLTHGYGDKIKIGTVSKVYKNKNGTFKVQSSIGDFIAKNVVFAAPQKSLKGVYDLPKPYLQQSVHVFYVKGIRKDIYRNKRSVVFRPKNHDISMMWGQRTGVDIIYSKYKKPNLNRYYREYHVLSDICWEPGIIIPRNQIIEQKLDKNMYLASDYNLSPLEDSFLTGLYAANQIIKG